MQQKHGTSSRGEGAPEEERQPLGVLLPGPPTVVDEVFDKLHGHEGPEQVRRGLLRPGFGEPPLRDQAAYQHLAPREPVGRIPPVFLDWYVALQRYTDTMRHDTALIAAAGSFFGGVDRGLELDESFLRSVRTPTCSLWGSEEPFATPGAEDRLVAAMPNAELERLPVGGHLPWLDDPEHAARTVRRFLGVRAHAIP